MSLPTTMEGLRRERDGDRRSVLSGNGWNGEVDAGLMKVAEDEGTYSDPSTLFVGGI